MPGPDVKPTAAAHLEAIRGRLVRAPTTAPATAPAAATRAAKAFGVAPSEGAGLFVRGYRHSIGQTPGWLLQRQRHLQQPGGRADVLRLTQLSLAADGQPGRLLKVDVYETPSPEAAQALMIELLTAFQVLPERIEIDQQVGDADICLPDDRARLFARGNLAVSATNAGPQLAPVGDLASALDAFLMAAPHAGAARKRGAALVAVAEDAMLRFSSPAGVLRQDADGKLTAEGGGPPPAPQVLDESIGGWVVIASDAGPEAAGPNTRTRTRTRRKR